MQFMYIKQYLKEMQHMTIIGTADNDLSECPRKIKYSRDQKGKVELNLSEFPLGKCEYK